MDSLRSWSAIYSYTSFTLIRLHWSATVELRIRKLLTFENIVLLKNDNKMYKHSYKLSTHFQNYQNIITFSDILISILYSIDNRIEEPNVFLLGHF